MARARATARHPQGWFHLVEQLGAAPDRAVFFSRMLDLQCKIVAAEYGAIWGMGPDGAPVLVSAWPAALGSAASGESAALRILSDAAASGFDKKFSHVLRVEGRAGASAGIGPHAFVTVMRQGGAPAAVSTCVAQCGDEQVIRSTAAVREVAAGLLAGFEARQEAAEQREDARRMRGAIALLATCHEAEGFHGSALSLVHELARQHDCARVSLGWARGRHVRLIAMSDTENLRRHSEQVALIELAMAECLDQQQPLIYPLPDGAEPLLAESVVYAHRCLAAGAPGRHVLSVPLRHRERWLGALTLERLAPPAEPFEPGAVPRLQLVADTLAPHLADRRRADRSPPAHAWHGLCRAAAHLVGPRHVAWKLGGLAAAGLLACLALGTWPYRIGAPFVLEARRARVVAAPFAEVIETVHVQEGDQVRAGDPLATLDTHQLALELDSARKQLFVDERELDAARERQDAAEAAQAEARGAQARARIDLVEYLMGRSQILSPIDGHVLSGRWHDRLGSMVEAGQPLFEIAPLDGADALAAVIHVDERDIDQLRQATADERKPEGEIATRSQPQRRYAIDFERVVPFAEPIGGVNRFSVRCAIRGRADDPQLASLRPGMEGRARLDAGRRPIRWLLTHRIVDTIRLWLWW